MNAFFDLKEGNIRKVDDNDLPQNNYFESNADPITPSMVTMLLSRSLFGTNMNYALIECIPSEFR